MITYITLGISIISFLFSTYLFFRNNLSARYKLGVAINESFPNIDQEVLFLRISFVNESSAPITIENLLILDCKKQRFASFGKQNHYNVSAGEVVPMKLKVENPFHPVESTFCLEKTSYLPIAVQPYSAYTGFFAFHFENEDARIVNADPSIFLEVETSKGFFTVPKRFAEYVTTVETRQDRIRSTNIFWNLSFTRQLSLSLKESILKLVKKLRRKIEHKLNSSRS